MRRFLKKIFFNLSWQAFVILLCGLVLSVTAVIFTLEEQSDEWAEQLRQEALEDTLILVGKLEVAEGEVMGILAMFRSMGVVNQNGFKTMWTLFYRVPNSLKNLSGHPGFRKKRFRYSL